MFCMDCLSGKTIRPDDSGAYNSNNVPIGGCQYLYFDGSICGKATDHYVNLCDDHFKQLYDTYNAFIGK